jgi:hypothetical protein
MSKFISRKWIATALAVAAVFCADMLGMPLSPETLDSIQNMVMALVGFQGTVDTVAAYKSGSAAAEAVRALQADEATDA